MPLQPKFLDYPNAQILLIGHHENALEKATDQEQQGEDDSKDKPLEEMEKLEDEDQIRIDHLKGFSAPLLPTPSLPSTKKQNFWEATDHEKATTPSLWISDSAPRIIPKCRLPGNAKWKTFVDPNRSRNSARRKSQLYTSCSGKQKAMLREREREKEK